jgi:hypothetical protein
VCGVLGVCSSSTARIAPPLSQRCTTSVTEVRAAAMPQQHRTRLLVIGGGLSNASYTVAGMNIALRAAAAPSRCIVWSKHAVRLWCCGSAQTYMLQAGPAVLCASHATCMMCLLGWPSGSSKGARQAGRCATQRCCGRVTLRGLLSSHSPANTVGPTLLRAPVSYCLAAYWLVLTHGSKQLAEGRRLLQCCLMQWISHIGHLKA